MARFLFYYKFNFASSSGGGGGDDDDVGKHTGLGIIIKQHDIITVSTILGRSLIVTRARHRRQQQQRTCLLSSQLQEILQYLAKCVEVGGLFTRSITQNQTKKKEALANVESRESRSLHLHSKEF
jgi:hypothetical protein